MATSSRSGADDRNGWYNYNILYRDKKRKKTRRYIYILYIQYIITIITKHRKGSFAGDVLYRRHHNYNTRIINRVLLYSFLASLVEYDSCKLKPRIVFKSDSIVRIQRVIIIIIPFVYLYNR